MVPSIPSWVCEIDPGQFDVHGNGVLGGSFLVYVRTSSVVMRKSGCGIAWIITPEQGHGAMFNKKDMGFLQAAFPFVIVFG